MPSTLLGLDPDPPLPLAMRSFPMRLAMRKFLLANGFSDLSVQGGFVHD
jgi:hypothetical protein